MFRMEDFHGYIAGLSGIQTMCSIVQQRLLQGWRRGSCWLRNREFFIGKEEGVETRYLMLLGQMKAVTKKGMFAAFI